MARILVIDDDANFATRLQQLLKAQFHVVEVAHNAETGLALIEILPYDLILLDLVLPGLSGIECCQQLRSQGDSTPILMLTSFDSEQGKVLGLDAGADDYLTKPFVTSELLARVRALLRRQVIGLWQPLVWHDLQMDLRSGQVSYRQQRIVLSSKEYQLLELFLRHQHTLFSPQDLIDRLWVLEETPTENTIRAHIKGLRKKLRQVGANDVLETVYGLGYRLQQNRREDTEIVVETVSSTELEISLSAPLSAPSLPAIAPISHPSSSSVSSNSVSSNSVSSNSVSSNKVISVFAPLWKRGRQTYLDRLSRIEQVVTTGKAGCLTEALLKGAQLEAHTLVGSLGSFGLNSASQLAQQIETQLKAIATPSLLAWTEIDQLNQQVRSLRTLVETAVLDAQSAIQLRYPHPPQQDRLLIITSDLPLADQLATVAIAQHLQVEICPTLTQAQQILFSSRHFSRYNAIVLDLSQADELEAGWSLLQSITSRQRSIATTVLTAGTEFSIWIQVARLGGQACLTKPVSPFAVIQAVTDLLQRSHPRNATIAILDDDRQILEILQQILEPWGFQLIFASDPQCFWQQLQQSHPDLLILNIAMPQVNGMEICQVIRYVPALKKLPILMLSSYTDPKTISQAFSVGADDYLTKPATPDDLVVRVLNRLDRSQYQSFPISS